MRYSLETPWQGEPRRIKRQLVVRFNPASYGVSFAVAITLFVPQKEDEFVVALAGFEQVVAGLFGEGLEILYRTRIRRNDLQHLPWPHVRQRFLGAQDGERAIEAACIEFLVKINAHFYLSSDPNIDWLHQAAYRSTRGSPCNDTALQVVDLLETL